MSYLETKGIVIKEVNTGEADKIVTLFSKTHGKISAFAKGARRPKNKAAAGTQFLCYGEFILFPGKDLYSVSSCQVIEPFYSIRNDIERLTYAAHFVDIVGDIIQENQPSSRLLQLFLNSLHMLTREDKSPELIARIFELRCLSILGYAPYVKGCMICGRTDVKKVGFSFKKCGFICDDHGCMTHDEYALELSVGASRAICHIVHSRIQELFNFKVAPEVLQELGKITKRYLRERLERDYTKLDFLKEL